MKIAHLAFADHLNFLVENLKKMQIKIIEDLKRTKDIEEKPSLFVVIVITFIILTALMSSPPTMCCIIIMIIIKIKIFTLTSPPPALCWMFFLLPTLLSVCHSTWKSHHHWYPWNNWNDWNNWNHWNHWNHYDKKKKDGRVTFSSYIWTSPPWGLCFIFLVEPT